MARGNNAVAATTASKLELASLPITFICFFAALYCFNQGDINDSDLVEVDLKMVYGAFLIPFFAWIMSLSRRKLVKNHPIWCFGVEIFQAIASSITMTGSVQLSMLKDDDKHFFESIGFITASLIFLKLALPDLEDCGVCDMLVALLLTRLNIMKPKLVPYVSGAYYIICRAITFGVRQLNKERPEEADANDPKRGEQLNRERPVEGESNEREALERRALVERVEREATERVERATRELVEREIRDQVETETRARVEREAREGAEREAREREDANALQEMSRCWHATQLMLRSRPGSLDDREFERMYDIIVDMQSRASRARTSSD